MHLTFDHVWIYLYQSNGGAMDETIGYIVMTSYHTVQCRQSSRKNETEIPEGSNVDTNNVSKCTVLITPEMFHMAYIMLHF